MTRQELLDHYQAQLCLLAKELVDDREIEASQLVLTAVQQIDAVLDEITTGGVEERKIRQHLVEPWRLQFELGVMHGCT